MNLNELAEKYITGDILWKLPKREFGKYMSDPAEEIVKSKIESELGIEVKKDGNDGVSAGHFDLYTENNYRIQVKFRSVDGVTPVSRQIYTHNWRQKLKYDVNDFDCIVLVLCHNGNRNPSDWIYCFIPSEKIQDTENINLMLKDIPPEILKEGLDWKQELSKYYKQFSEKQK